MSSTAQKTSLFDKISLENFGLGETTVTEDSSFSLEAATAEFDRLASGLATSFVVLGHSQLMAAALESSDVEVSAQTAEVMEVNEMSMSAILDTLEVSMEAEEEAKGEAKDEAKADAKADDKEPGMVGKAWEKIKSFFKMIGAWFKKQWKKLTGAISGLANRIRGKAKNGAPKPNEGGIASLKSRIDELKTTIITTKESDTDEAKASLARQEKALAALEESLKSFESIKDQTTAATAGWTKVADALDALENDGFDKYVEGEAKEVAKGNGDADGTSKAKSAMKIIKIEQRVAANASKLAPLAK